MINEVVTKKKSNNKFDDFLKQHSNSDNKNETTHTRIGNKDLKIWGGKYYISDENEEEFLTLYANELNVGNKEYFTETQLETDSSILIDVDLRFNFDVKKRLYNQGHLEDLRDLYLEELKKMYQFDEQPFYYYQFEKTEVNPVEEKKVTKDGVHIIIGIKTKREDQLILRENIKNQLSNMWTDLPIVNTWEEVLDKGISAGTCNWQLYGSRKPGFEAYRLTKIYQIKLDPADQEFMIKTEKVPELITTDLLKRVSARCKTNPQYFYKSDYIASKVPANEKVVHQSHHSGGAFKNRNSMHNIQNILDIKNKEMLTEQVNVFLESIEATHYDLRETYDYTMALPEKYYGTGSFPYWLKVGWALRNIDDSLFIVWIEFSSKWEHFKYSDVINLYNRWLEFDSGNPRGLTRRSIMHWLKEDNLAEYNKIRMKSTEYFINESLKNPKCGDVDIAHVLYELYKDSYVCISIKGDIWYHFKDHRWKEDERGTSLRKHISDELRDIYKTLLESKKKIYGSLPDEEKEKIVPQLSKLQDIIKKLGQSNEKDHIMKEAKEKFYDEGHVFVNKLDTNPWILCFTNGVIDFQENVFRNGRPDDYVSKCTNNKYVPISETPNPSQQIIIDGINDFMAKLFPSAELRNYMWEHLASTLIGTSTNETFHMYIGEGRNGKSVLTDLMKKMLGEYSGEVPLSIITAARTKPGGLAPELVELKGVRYAVMQEPSPDEKINVGPMKMLTSGTDVIQCRAPYMPQTVRFNPQFKLCVCSNTFMKVESQDFGTWRRIRVIDFVSLFTENPVQGDPIKPFQFKVENVRGKFEIWKEIFLSMLVNVAKRTKGDVKDCECVMASSNSYKNGQDYFGSFVKEMIVIDPLGRISQTQLKIEFDKWYISLYDDKSRPKPKDIFDYFDRTFGKHEKNEPWKGISILRCETSGEEIVQKEEDFKE